MHLFHLSWDSYRKYSRSACDSWKIIHMLFQKLSHLVLCGLEGCFLIKNGPRKQFGQHLVFAWSYYWTPNKTSTCAALAALGTIKNSISTLWSTVITEFMRKRQRPKMAERERVIQAAHQQTFKWTEYHLFHNISIKQKPLEIIIKVPVLAPVQALVHCWRSSPGKHICEE